MTDHRLRIIFMGTPDFALAALIALHQSSHDIVAVYTQPPRPKGRGHKVQNSPVHDYAAQHNIPAFHPGSLKSPEEQARFAALKADIAIVAAYGLLLPKTILQAPKFGCVNIHASLLPRWRGASPIQRAIWEGDTETGITLMQMDEGLDTGPMIAQQKIPITDQTTSALLQGQLAALGGQMIVQAMGELSAALNPQSEEHKSAPSPRNGLCKIQIEGKGPVLVGEKQEEARATYAPLLKKEDGVIDWAQTAQQIHRQVRALNPWPGTWAVLHGKRFKILEVRISESRNLRISEKNDSEILRFRDFEILLSKHGEISCGGGTALQILKLQPEGKNPMDFAAAVNGGYLSS